MVKMYFNNQETKEERSRSRFDSQEDKECRTRELNAQREGRETDSDICEDNPKEENKGILVQSCDNGEPRAMKKDTDSDSDRDSEHVSNHRRRRMTSGPRRPATSKAKRLAINSLTHSGVKHSSQQSDPPATRQSTTVKTACPHWWTTRSSTGMANARKSYLSSIPCLHAASHATSRSRGQSAPFRPHTNGTIRSLGVGRFAGYRS